MSLIVGALLALVLLGVGVAHSHVDPAKELALVRHSAAEGDHESQLMLGLMLHEGRDGLKQDDKAARRWMEASAAGGNAYAADTLGTWYAQGIGVRAQPDVAVHWWRMAAHRGLAAGERDLGRAYFKGIGMTPNYDRAVLWLDRASSDNDAAARKLLREMYREGLAGDEDLVKGQGWWSKLNALLSGGARTASGSRGEVLHVLAQEGQELMKQANAGDPTAQYQLAWRYRTGVWVDQDPQQALAWYRKAAANGSRKAMDALAQAYDEGLLGLKPDPAQAGHWRAQAQARSGE